VDATGAYLEMLWQMSYNVIIILSLTVRIVPGALGRPVGVVLKHLALDARSLTEPMVRAIESQCHPLSPEFWGEVQPRRH